MSVPRCHGRYMDCSECIHYQQCYILRPRNGTQLRKICIRCEECIFSGTCAVRTLVEMVI